VDIELLKKLNWGNFSLIVLVVVLFDQISKVFLRIFMPEKVFINQNYIFGFCFDVNIFFLILFLFLVFVWGYYSKDKLGQALIFSGGASNAIDRVYFGGVVDFNIKSILAFNFADVAIVVGVIYILFRFFENELFNQTVK
jgi:lipoprotein signal peptidase